jgi:hypothetical protein
MPRGVCPAAGDARAPSPQGDRGPQRRRLSRPSRPPCGSGAGCGPVTTPGMKVPPVATRCSTSIERERPAPPRPGRGRDRPRSSSAPGRADLAVGVGNGLRARRVWAGRGGSAPPRVAQPRGAPRRPLPRRARGTSGCSTSWASRLPLREDSVELRAPCAAGDRLGGGAVRCRADLGREHEARAAREALGEGEREGDGEQAGGGGRARAAGAPARAPACRRSAKAVGLKGAPGRGGWARTAA